MSSSPVPSVAVSKSVPLSPSPCRPPCDRRDPGRRPGLQIAHEDVGRAVGVAGDQVRRRRLEGGVASVGRQHAAAVDAVRLAGQGRGDAGVLRGRVTRDGQAGDEQESTADQDEIERRGGSSGGERPVYDTPAILRDNPRVPARALFIGGTASKAAGRRPRRPAGQSFPSPCRAQSSSACGRRRGGPSARPTTADPGRACRGSAP